jgi:hypothetical protein
VSAAFLAPLGDERSMTHLSLANFSPQSPADGAVERNIVWPEYFKTMGTPLIAGREFQPTDDGAAPLVAIVNESLAHYYFRDANPIGQPLWLARDTTGPSVTIVGVVRDAAPRDIREARPRLVFLPARQANHGIREPMLLVRVAPAAAPDAAQLRRALNRISAVVSVRDITTPRRQIDRALLPERLLATLVGLFGPLALLLAAVGLYALLATEIARRTREIGVHIALGATPRGIIAQVFRQGLRLVVIGVLAGAAAAIGAARAIQGYLYGTSAADPAIVIFAATALLAAGAAACWLPARRAARVDPLIALRAE